MGHKAVNILSSFASSRTFLLALVLSAIFIGLWQHTYRFNLDLNIAVRGFSAIEAIEARNNPTGFERDFPGGARVTTSASPTIYFFYFLNDVFGFNGLVSLYLMIFLELVAMAVGVWIFWQSIVSKLLNGALQHVWQSNLIYGSLILLVIISDLQRANLANFGFPFYHGQFYGFADGLRLAAIGIAIRGKWSVSALLLAICFIVHPIKAMMAMFFVSTIALFEFKSLFRVKYIVSGFVAIAVCAIWYLGFLREASEVVPLEDFVGFTRTFQSHWYPIELDLFTNGHAFGLSPFVSSFLMVSITLLQPDVCKRFQRQMIAGLSCLIFLSIIGIIISHLAISMDLIRVSLVRASTLISLLVPALIMLGFVNSLRQSDWFIASAQAGYLLASYQPLGGHGEFSLLFACLTISLYIMREKLVSLFSLTTMVIGIGVLLYVAIVSPNDNWLILTFITPLILASLIYVALRFSSNFLGKQVFAIIVAPFFVFPALHSHGKSELSEKFETRAQAYLETQLWAKENTPETSLFMVDPCYSYGWRDFSGRASVGTVREWLMTGWIYRGGLSEFEKGKEFASTLGLNYEQFKNRAISSRQICALSREQFYDTELRAPMRFASVHSVNYFVFEKSHMSNWKKEKLPSLVFENDYYAVLDSKDLGH